MRGTEKRAPAQSSIWFAYLVRSYTLPSSLNPGGTEQQTRVDSCNIRRQANINISLKQWIAIEAFDAIRRCQYSNAPFSPPDTQIIRNKKYYWQTSLFLHWFPFSLFPGRLSRQHLYPILHPMRMHRYGRYIMLSDPIALCGYQLLRHGNRRWNPIPSTHFPLIHGRYPAQPTFLMGDLFLSTAVTTNGTKTYVPCARVDP